MKAVIVRKSSPYAEKKVDVVGIKNPITLGIKLYGKDKRESLESSYEAIGINIALEKANAELEEFIRTGDRTTDDFYSTRKSMQDAIKKLTTKYVSDITEFYKDQVLFIKNASLLIEEDGVQRTISIADTRVIEPIESLWNTSEECLAVLLDYYFEEDSYKDSLPSLISSTIFNYPLKKEEKLKN